MKKIILALTGCLFFSISGKVCAQEPSTEYKDVLMKYMHVSGANIPLDNSFDQLIKMLGLNEAEQAIINNSLRDKAFENLWNKMAPVYERHISLEDLRAALEFYESPAGQRMADVMPELVKDSETVGIEWGMELMQMIADELN